LLCIVEVGYDNQEIERYLLPVSFIEASQSNAIAPVGIISLAYINEKRGFVIDALYDERFQQALLSHAESVYQQDGKVDFVRGKGLSGEDINAPITSKALTLSSSNSAMVFGENIFSNFIENSLKKPILRLK
jgi:maltose alpha-D-glucosyltransferase/alpha-amylase